MRLDVYRSGILFREEPQPLVVRYQEYGGTYVTRKRITNDCIPVEMGLAALLLGGVVDECPRTGEKPTVPNILGKTVGYVYRNNSLLNHKDTSATMQWPLTECTECGFINEGDDISINTLRTMPHPPKEMAITNRQHNEAAFPWGDIGWQKGRLAGDERPGALALVFGTHFRPVTEQTIETYLPDYEILDIPNKGQFGVAVQIEEPSEEYFLDLSGLKLLQNI